MVEDFINKLITKSVDASIIFESLEDEENLQRRQNLNWWKTATFCGYFVCCVSFFVCVVTFFGWIREKREDRRISRNKIEDQMTKELYHKAT